MSFPKGSVPFPRGNEKLVNVARVRWNCPTGPKIAGDNAPAINSVATFLKNSFKVKDDNPGLMMFLTNHALYKSNEMGISDNGSAVDTILSAPFTSIISIGPNKNLKSRFFCIGGFF